MPQEMVPGTVRLAATPEFARADPLLSNEQREERTEGELPQAGKGVEEATSCAEFVQIMHEHQRGHKDGGEGAAIRPCLLRATRLADPVPHQEHNRPHDEDLALYGKLREALEGTPVQMARRVVVHRISDEPPSSAYRQPRPPVRP